jgi:membrane protein YqaA with SNARE-associated domain
MTASLAALLVAPLTGSPFVHALWVYVRRFGALAFFPLGLLDMSFLAPGSFDALLIVLTAAHKELWWYYALMATGGSVFGTLLNFHIGRRGGAEAIEKKLGPRRSKKIFAAFERWGFWAMFAGAIAPPPMPASAFVLAAGALRYRLHKFLLAWTTGRLLRFGLLGWITARYGDNIFHWFRGYYRPALWTVAIIGVFAGAAALWLYIRERRRHSAELNSDAAKQAEHNAA